MEDGRPAFSRVLLKLSGEALMGDLEYGADPARIQAIAGQVASVRERGVEVAIVVGAGNIYRGLEGAAVGRRVGHDTENRRQREPAWQRAVIPAIGQG